MADIIMVHKDPARTEYEVKGTSIPDVVSMIPELSMNNLASENLKHKVMQKLKEFGKYRMGIGKGARVINYFITIENWTPQPITFQELWQDHMLGLQLNVSSIGSGIKLGALILIDQLPENKKIAKEKLTLYYGDFKTQVASAIRVNSMTENSAKKHVDAKMSAQYKTNRHRLIFFNPISRLYTIITPDTFKNYKITIQNLEV